MQILQAGQRETLPEAQVQLHLSGAATRGIVVWITEKQGLLRADLARHPLSTLVSPHPQGGLDIDLGRLPADIHSVWILHPGEEAQEHAEQGAVQVLSGGAHYGYLGPAGRRPVWLLEFYRRNGAWRVRAVGETFRTFAQLNPELPGLIAQAETRAQVQTPGKQVSTVRPAKQGSGSGQSLAGQPAPASGPAATPPTTAAGIIIQAFWQLRGLIPSSEHLAKPPGELPQVTELRRALKVNLERAKRSGDPLWTYDATAAIDDYLPTTCALHARHARPEHDSGAGNGPGGYPANRHGTPAAGKRRLGNPAALPARPGGRGAWRAGRQPPETLSAADRSWLPQQRKESRYDFRSLLNWHYDA